MQNISYQMFFLRNNQMYLLKQRLDILKSELISLYNPNLEGSEWILSEMDEMIHFFEDHNIITKGIYSYSETYCLQIV